MSSRAKHALRSHRGYTNNEAVFSKFEYRASKIKDVKKLKAINKKMPIIERVKKLFKRHQDR